MAARTTLDASAVARRCNQAAAAAVQERADRLLHDENRAISGGGTDGRTGAVTAAAPVPSIHRGTGECHHACRIIINCSVRARSSSRKYELEFSQWNSFGQTASASRHKRNWQLGWKETRGLGLLIANPGYCSLPRRESAYP